MSDTKSSSGSSAASGMKATIPFIGDRAQAYVFGQLTFVPNKLDHRANRLGETKDSSGTLTKQMTAWRTEAAATGAKTDILPGAGKLGPLIGALYLSLSRPPTTGCCGEMALLAYRKIITLAIQYDCPMAVAAVSIGGDWGSAGNHSFVLIGSDPGFAAELAADPKTLKVTTDRLPAAWGDNVYVCDPWIDGGRCSTFKATGRDKRTYETPWEPYLAKVRMQADDDVIKRAFNTLGGKLTLQVDDSVVISSTTSATESATSSSSSSSSTSAPAKKTA